MADETVTAAPVAAPVAATVVDLGDITTSIPITPAVDLGTTTLPIAPELRPAPVQVASLRPSYLTAEFWGTVLVHGMVIVTLLSQQAFTGNAYVDGAIKVSALIVAVVNQLFYNKTRSSLKSAVADLEGFSV